MVQEKIRVRILKFFEKNWQIILLVELLFFCLLYSLLSLRRHNRFDSFAYDLGIFDQVIWRYSRFKIPFSTIKGKIIFGDHFNPSLVFLSPLFWFWNDVRILLIFQSFWLVFSAWPVFLLARHRKLPSFLAMIIVFIYLLFYGFQHALNFDFHAVVIGVGLMPWLIYFWLKRNWKKFIILALVFAGFKENLCLFLIALGIISFLKNQRKTALFLIIPSLIYFWIVIKVIIPFFSPQGYEYQPVVSSHFFTLIKNLFWPFEKLKTWFYSLGWFSFLPLLSPLTLIPVLVDLAQYFEAGDRFAATWGLFMHYRASLGPVLIWGTIESLAFLQKKIKNIFLIGLFILILPLFWQYSLHLPLNRLSKRYFWREEEFMKDNRKIFSLIPQNASLAAQNNLVPHLSHRDKIYLVWPRKNEQGKWWLFWDNRPKYLMVDLHSGQAITHLLVNSEKELRLAVKNMEDQGLLKMVKSKGESRLYEIQD